MFYCGSIILVQVTLTEAEHAQFMGWLRTLRDRWGLTGWIATIYEAVKRQAESEGAVTEVGRDLDSERIAQARAAVAREIRDKALAAPDRLTATWLAAQLQPIIFAGDPIYRKPEAPNTRTVPETDTPLEPPTSAGELFQLDPAPSFDIPAGGA